MQVHPQQLFPAQPFDIFYFIRNHLDATTYYVRGVLYDIKTGDVLATANLSPSANNGRLYTATIQAPADSTGQGRSIVAVATVYTDSDYTAKSPDYAEQEQFFLVRAELPFLGGGGGIDARTVREIVSEELAKMPKPAPMPAMPWESLFGSLGALQREVNRIPKDDPETVDLEPIRVELRSLKAALDARPTFQPTDLAPLQAQLDDLAQAVTGAITATKATGATILSEQERITHQADQALLEAVKQSLEDFMTGQTMNVSFAKSATPSKPTPSPVQPNQAPDLSHLML